MTFEEFLKERYDENNIFQTFSLMYESFDSPIQVKYFPPKDIEGSMFWVGEFSINDKDFNIIFEVPDEQNTLGVNFSQIVKGEVNHGFMNNLTKQEVLSVFSTIITETKKIIKANDYDSIFFQANDSKKFKVYDKIISRYIEGYSKVTNDKSVILLKDNTVENVKKLGKVKLKFKKIKV